MHIVYSAATCSNQVYALLFGNAKAKPSYQAQKYHRLLIEGLAAHTRVDVVATPPTNRKCMDRAFLSVPSHAEGGAHYHHICAVRSPYLKGLVMGFGTFFKTLRLADRDSVVVVDCLNRVVATSALLAARLRGRRCLGIVTDLPDMFENESKFFRAWGNWIVSHCTDYVVLTEAMNAYINPTGKPYVVLEGHADVTMEAMEPSLSKKIKPRVLMYAGGISARYGADILVRGFQLANIPDTQLHFYGAGDYVEKLTQITRQDNRIYYGGLILSTQVVEKEQQATLLVNPRPTGAEYVKYSFPSKTMEYMSTGTPVLMTVLPGMPKAYYPYVYLLEEESPEGMAEKLRELLSLSDETLFRKGLEARTFILKEKNNVVQAKKILDMLEKTRK